jgi:DNA-binding transcriptional MerR regulator
MSEKQGKTGADRASIAAVERETGLGKDTLRVWERRYGFPQPERDSAGDRAYPADQVERLQLIRRLIDTGHRPGRIVPLELPALKALLATPSSSASPQEATPGLAMYLDLVARHNVAQLKHELAQAAVRLGLMRFVADVVAPLNTAVGDAWMQGRFQVFEEHLYTECVTGVLRSAIAGISLPPGPCGPRVLLTTFPNEAHSLGLLMVEALFTLEGCLCLSLGIQTPIGDIAQAAQAHRADIVALSFTAVQGAKTVTAGLRELRDQLPAQTALWVGGECPALYQRPLPGVLAVRTLHALPGQIAWWRQAAAAGAAPSRGD